MCYLFQHLIHYPPCIVCLLTKFVDMITLVNITYLQHSTWFVLIWLNETFTFMFLLTNCLQILYCNIHFINWMLTLVHLLATSTSTLVANVATLCINCYNIGFIILLTICLFTKFVDMVTTVNITYFTA